MRRGGHGRGEPAALQKPAQISYSGKEKAKNRVEDVQQQLTDLRRRVARINLKYKSGSSPGRAAPAAETLFPLPRPDHYFADEYLSGEVVETPHGTHFETERLYEAHRRHGSIGVSDLADLPEDLLGALSEGEVRSAPPLRWGFLDTETTGLAGGAGTYAFLVGVGRITAEGFRVRQFFMRDFAEEASLLHALGGHLAQFDVLVTYNGKTYDQPLLETRYRMARARPPFDRLDHLDLLYGARRLWKLQFESCRLVDLEQQILGFEREGDIPGELIPYLYFEYVRRREALRLVPVFHHNAVDILTLACLTAIVPWAFRSSALPDHMEGAPLRRGPECLGVARWFLKTGNVDQALGLMRRAIELGLPDALLFRALWDLACEEKRRDATREALSLFTDLATSPNPYQGKALEELAKHYEHREREYELALDMARQALALEPSEALLRRTGRLERKLGHKTSPPSLPARP
jgi:uncharacterized protein